MLQLRLLLFAFQTALTTAICIVEYSFWPELSAAEKSNLGKLYIPYFVFGEPESFPFPMFPFHCRRGKGGGGETVGLERFADTERTAVVMFIDMYGRVKARLMAAVAAGQSLQKSKST